jgi:hypothetical protein
VWRARPPTAWRGRLCLFASCRNLDSRLTSLCGADATTHPASTSSAVVGAPRWAASLGREQREPVVLAVGLPRSRRAPSLIPTVTRAVPATGP